MCQQQYSVWLSQSKPQDKASTRNYVGVDARQGCGGMKEVRPVGDLRCVRSTYFDMEGWCQPSHPFWAGMMLDGGGGLWLPLLPYSRRSWYVTWETEHQSLLDTTYPSVEAHQAWLKSVTALTGVAHVTSTHIPAGESWSPVHICLPKENWEM